MKNKNAANKWAERTEEREAKTEQYKAETWECHKRLADALLGFIERITSEKTAATDGELQALPGVADICRRLL